MITLKANSLNLLTGRIGSGKTPLVANIGIEYINKGLNVVWLSNDVDQNNIKKTVHCLYNEVNFVELKYDKDERTATNLVLPANITIIDDVDTIDKIKAAHADISKQSNVDLIIIDNINFLKDNVDRDYKERIDWNNMLIDEFAKENNVTILATVNLLDVLDYQPVDFIIKDMGTFIHIDRRIKDKVPTKFFDVTIDNDLANKLSIELSYKNLKMQVEDDKHVLDEEALYGG